MISVFRRAALAGQRKTWRHCACAAVAFACVAPGAIAQDTIVMAGDIALHISNQGRLSSLEGPGQEEYLVVGRDTPLVSLIVADTETQATNQAVHLRPDSAFCDLDRQRCHLTFAQEIALEVGVRQHPGYATFELEAIENPHDKDIRVAIWGPLPVTLYQRVGDILGVAYNRDFAIGVLGLNPRTLAGAPFEYPWFTGIGDIVDPIPLGSEASRTSRNYFSISAARVTDYGTLLQFFSRDYTKERHFSPYEYWGADWEQAVAPLPPRLGSLIGSSIAVYGISRSEETGPGEHLRDVMARTILGVIGQIEVDQGLPHPTVGGVWAKLSPQSRHRYMDVGGLTAENMAEAAELALSAGLRWIYQREEGWGVFAHGGGFPVGDAYGGTDDGLAAAVESAEARGVRVGTHTLSGFLRSHDDGYIRSELTPHLAEQGRAVLSRPLKPGSMAIHLRNEPPFDRNAFEDFESSDGRWRYKYVRVDDELIAYGHIDEAATGEIVLSFLQRGVHGTDSAHHEAGATLRKFWYLEEFFASYMAGPGLLEPMASRLADAINNTGLRIMAYDGLESWIRSGYDMLLANQFVLDVYDRLHDKTDFQNEASIVTHFNWHLHNRLNWGELRGSVFTQQQRYRWANQPLFARNLLPNALGAYFATTGDSTVEAEWVGSKVASFDAGFTLQEHINVFRSKPRHLAAIRRWMEATEAGAFSDLERFGMRDPASRFHLEELDAGRRWRLWDEDVDGARTNPRIVEAPEDGHVDINIAPSANVRASSIRDKGFPEDNIVDEYTGVDEDEFAHNNVAGVSEWAAATDDESPWIELVWDTPHLMNHIMVFDRADGDINTISVRLRTSDGSSWEIHDIPANGDGKLLKIQERAIESLRIELVETSGVSPGLAEIVVIGREAV